MNYTKMKAIDFTKNKSSPKWVKIKMEFDDDGKKIFKGDKTVTQDKIFTPEYNKQREARNKLTGREFNYIAFDTNTYIQFDIDIGNDDEYNSLTKEAHDFLEFMDNHFPYYKSASKKYGKHYILPDLHLYEFWNKLYEMNNNISDLDKWKNDKPEALFNYLKKEYGFIEILNGQWAWCGIDNEIIMPKTPFDIMEDGEKLRSIFNNKFSRKLMNLPEIKEEPKPEKPKSTINMNAPPSHMEGVDKQDMFEEMIRNIDMEKINEYKHFYRILGSIKCAGKQYVKIIKAIASKSPKARENYNEWFDKYEKSIKGRFDKAIIYDYSKLSNPEKHYEIYCKYNYNEESQYSSEFLADVFLATNTDNILVAFHKSFPSMPCEIYFYNEINNVWVNESKGGGDVIKCAIGRDIKTYLKNELKLHKSKPVPDKDENFEEYTDYIDKLKDINKMKKKILEPTARDNIYTILKQIIKTHKGCHQEFDNNTNLLPFMNCVYNFEANQWQCFSKEDYIMTKVQYDFRDPDEEIEKEFIEFWDSLFKSDALKQDMLYIIATCLLSKQFQYLFILVGEGANGKSVVQNLIEAMLTDAFYCSASGNMLTKPISADKPSPEFAKMSGKRVCVYQEPNGSDKFSQETLKQITGDGKINARMLYSNDTICRMVCSNIVVLNDLPQIDGKLQHALARRIINMPFSYNFTNEQWKIDAQPHIYKKRNDKFASSEWIEEAKYVLLKMCLEFIKDYKVKYASNKDTENPNDIFNDTYEFSEEVYTSTNNYLSEANEVINWVNENIVYEKELKEGGKVVNEVRLNLNEFYENFKQSSVYENMDRAERNRLKKQPFIDQICNQPQYGRFYDPQMKICGKNQRNVLKNHRMRTEDEIDIYLQSKNGYDNDNDNDDDDDDEEQTENIIIEKNDDINDNVPKKLIRKKNESDDDYNKRCMI